MKKEFTMEFLKERTKQCLEMAKSTLEEGQDIAPVALIGKYGVTEQPVMMKFTTPEAKERSYAMVQEMILHPVLQPDYCIHVADAWMLKLDKKEDELKAKRIQKHFKPGMIEKDPERLETIVVYAGSVLGMYGLFQQYRRENGKIIYEELVESEGAEIQTAIFEDVWEERKARGL